MAGKCEEEMRGTYDRYAYRLGSNVMFYGTREFTPGTDETVPMSLWLSRLVRAVSRSEIDSVVQNRQYRRAEETNVELEKFGTRS